MKTATPETDAAVNASDGWAIENNGVSADFARKLERERDAMKAAIRILADHDFGSRGWNAECESAALRLRAFISKQ